MTPSQLPRRTTVRSVALATAGMLSVAALSGCSSNTLADAQPTVTEAATTSTTLVPATTSDLLPTLCALTGQPLPARPLDGIDLTPLLDGAMTARPAPIQIWNFDSSRFRAGQAEPYLDPELQKGTSPLAKLQGGKATRDFLNYRHPGPLTEDDYRGPRAIIDGRYKLVIHDGRRAEPRRELFDLEADPGEKTDLSARHPATVETLQRQLRTWQDSVLQSLLGRDYGR